MQALTRHSYILIVKQLHSYCKSCIDSKKFPTRFINWSFIRLSNWLLKLFCKLNHASTWLVFRPSRRTCTLNHFFCAYESKHRLPVLYKCIEITVNEDAVEWPLLIWQRCLEHYLIAKLGFRPIEHGFAGFLVDAKLA